MTPSARFEELARLGRAIRLERATHLELLEGRAARLRRQIREHPARVDARADLARVLRRIKGR